MNVRNKVKTYTQYQVDKIIDEMQADFEHQWQTQIEDITDKLFDNVKADLFAQFMSVAMATLEKYNGFTVEQTTKFYNDVIALLNLMKAKPLGKDFSPQDTIDNVKKENNIDLDTELKQHVNKLF
jgi:uncharacterized protein YjgD (DUF1641 family)